MSSKDKYSDSISIDMLCLAIVIGIFLVSVVTIFLGIPLAVAWLFREAP